LEKEKEQMLSDFSTQHLHFHETEESFLHINKVKLDAEAAGQLMRVEASQMVANVAMIKAMRLLCNPKASLNHLQDERRHFEQLESLYCLERALQSLLESFTCPAPEYATKISVMIYKA
jgi:hypothetical protein